MTAALARYAVVDLSDSIAGQYCSRLFADFGARTTLVEPEGGSAVRRIGPFRADGESLTFFHLNTGKARSEARWTDDAAALADLVAGADVVVVEARHADRVRAANPAAIVAAVSAFGTDGPYADWAAPEIVVQAMSGMMASNGVPGREPLYGTGNRASYAAGLAAYISATAALYARAGGQTVSVDVAETANAMCFPYVLQHIYNGTDRRRGDQDIPAGAVLCRGTWVCIWVYAFRFVAMCGALGLEALVDDPRFAEPAERTRNWDALFAAVQEKVRDEDPEAVVRRLQDAQVIAACAYRPTELVNSPHLRARTYWEALDEGGVRRLMLGAPFRLSRTPRPRADAGTAADLVAAQ